jgi:hypothetical protein
MLDEPAGLRPRWREDCSVLAGRVHTAGVFSSRLVRSPLDTRQRPRAPRKNPRVPLRACSALPADERYREGSKGTDGSPHSGRRW